MKKPHVVVLLDESGSMNPEQDAVISTFNEYTKSVKESAKTISLFTFDSRGVRELFRKIPAGECREITKEDYRPNALTPLFDSMAKVIKKFEGSKRNVQFVTHTDGAENDSREWNYDKVSALVEKMTQKGWLFVYLGEGLQGSAQMANMAGLKVNFSSANRGAAMTSVGDVTRNYSDTGSVVAADYTADGTDAIDVDENAA